MSNLINNALLKHAIIGAGLGMMTGFLYGSLTWLPGLALLGAALAVIAELFDEVLYRHPTPDSDSSRYAAASATVTAYMIICFSIVGIIFLTLLY